MFRTLLGFLLAAVLLGWLACGCSSETTRVIGPVTTSGLDSLSTSIEQPSGQTLEDYISRGYYVPDDTTGIEDDQANDRDNPSDRFGNDDGSDKPIDNGSGRG